MRQEIQHGGKLWGVLGLLLLPLIFASSVSANRFTSPSYTIDTSVIGASLAGPQASPNYRMTSSGGESVVGNGASGSYLLGQGYVKTLEKSLDVSLQPEGLTAYWPLDNAAPGGTAFDSSINGNDGVYSTGSASEIGYKVGNSWYGSTGVSSVDIPNSSTMPSGNTMTISGWLTKGSTTGQYAIVTKWDYAAGQGAGGQSSWALQTAPGNTELRMFVSNSSFDPGDAYVDTTNAYLNDSTWYYFTVVYDGTQSNANRVKIYLNGTQLTTNITGTLPTTLNPSTAAVSIGNFPGLSRYWEGGSIDELKLYDRVLTQTEITAEYTAGSLGVPTSFEFPSLTPGISKSANVDIFVQTDAPGYSLAIDQNNDLTSGSYTIPAISGSIGSPVSWSEGTTKGLGFSLYGTNATGLPGTWNSGNSYAAFPNSTTTFYTRTGYTGGQKDKHNMRLRLDVPTTQAAATYENTMTITGTMTP